MTITKGTILSKKKLQDNYKKGKRWLQKRYEMRIKKVHDDCKKVMRWG